MCVCICMHWMVKQGACVWLINVSCVVNGRWEAGGMYVHVKLLHCSIFTPCVPWLHVIQVWQDSVFRVGVRVLAVVVGDSLCIVSHPTLLRQEETRNWAWKRWMFAMSPSMGDGHQYWARNPSLAGWLPVIHNYQSYSGRNNLTHQSSPSWSVGDQLPRLAKWARDNTGVLLLTRGSVQDRETLPSTITLCWNKVLQFIKYIKEVTETDQGFRYNRHAWAKSWACCWQMRYTLTSGGIATVSVH